MASEHDVKRYLAHWFQLGKPLVVRNGQDTVLPTSVIRGDRYSAEFEALWQQVTAPDAGDCYLQGTSQTIAELLTTRWEIDPCARCAMLVPMQSFGLPPEECPCSDLPTWPNTELPMPRSPVSTTGRLGNLRDRLNSVEAS